MKQILGEQDADVLLLTETKVYKYSAIHFDGCQSFSAVRNKRSGGGLYIGVKHGLCQSLLCNRGENAEFIMVRMEGKYNGYRIVLACGPQEKAFYEGFSVEVDNIYPLTDGDSLLLAGGFSAKLGSEIINCDTHTMSKNGKLLHDLIQIYNLYLLNSSKLCSGVLTRTRQFNGRQDIQYLIMFLSHLTSTNKSDQWKLMRKTS